jgi:hypothetical protein
MIPLIHLAGLVLTTTAAALFTPRLGLLVAGLVLLWTWRVLINPNRN